MDNGLLKSLINFYSKLQTIESRRKELFIKIKDLLNSIQSYMEQMRHVSR